jgi:hypothetical protein
MVRSLLVYFARVLRPRLALLALVSAAPDAAGATAEAWIGLRPGTEDSGLEGGRLEIDLSAAEPPAAQLPAGPLADWGMVRSRRFLVVRPLPLIGGEDVSDRELYNRWLSRLHRLALEVGPRVDAWVLQFPDAAGSGPFGSTHPLYSQLLKSSATEIRASDRQSTVLWWTSPPPGPIERLRPWWPDGSLAYFDGVIVPDHLPVTQVRAILPRADFELWVAARDSFTTVNWSDALQGLIQARAAGVQAHLWPGEAGPASQIGRFAEVVNRTLEAEFAIAEGIEAEPPPGQRMFVLLDADGLRVRIVLFGRGQGTGGELRLGLGTPREARWLAPLTGRRGELSFHRRGAELVLGGLPTESLLVVDLVGALPQGFQAASVTAGQMSGEEVMARAEAYSFWLRRQLPQIACRLEAEWHFGDQVVSVDSELIYEPASSTAWVHLLSERRGGLPFDPNRERFLFFERGGGVATPLVQAVDEDHDYTRLPDLDDAGDKRIVVAYRPKPQAREQTSGVLWLDPDSYAVVRREVTDAAPGFPLSHTAATTSFVELPGGLWLPETTEQIDTGSVLGFSFTSRSRTRLHDLVLSPADVPARVRKSLESSHPVLIWNEERDQLIVLRKSKRRPAARAASESPPQPVAEDYLLRFSFGQGLEASAIDRASAGAPGQDGRAAGSGAGTAETELDRLSRELGGVELLRGGDPKRLGGWAAGVSVAGQTVAPFGFYSRIWLDWLGRRDWQFALLTAGVVTAARWTDAHLGASRWSGSFTAVLPLLPGPESFRDRGEDEIPAQELRRWSPALGISARRELGSRIGVDLGLQAAVHLFDETSETQPGFRVPRSHLEGRAHVQLDYHRPRFAAGLRGELGLRSAWSSWGFGQTDPGPSFTRLQVWGSRSFRIAGDGALGFGWTAGTGWDLDRFSGFGLGGIEAGLAGSRLVLPVPQAIVSRYGGLDAGGEIPVQGKLRLGLEAAWMATSDEDLLADGRPRPGADRYFLSGGVRAGFNFLWDSQASIRAGISAETGSGDRPVAGYLQILVSRLR